MYNVSVIHLKLQNYIHNNKNISLFISVDEGTFYKASG